MSLKELLVATIRGATATVALFFGALLIPLLGLAVPYPAAVALLRNGLPVGLAVLATVAVTVGLVPLAAGQGFGLSNSLIYLFLFGPASVLLPLLLRRGNGAARAIAGAVALSVLLALLLVMILALQGVDVSQVFAQQVKASAAEALRIFSQNGVGGEDLRSLQATLTVMVDLLLRLYPGLLVVSSGLLAACTTALVRLNRGRLENPPAIGSLATFRTPEPLVWGVILAGFTLLLPYPPVRDGALNLLLVLAPLYFCQGLAVVLAMFQRFQLATMARLLFFLLLFLFTPFMAVLLTVLGLFDLWGDFRTPRTPQNL